MSPWMLDDQEVVIVRICTDPCRENFMIDPDVEGCPEHRNP